MGKIRIEKLRIKKKRKIRPYMYEKRKKRRKITQEPEPLIFCQFTFIGMEADYRRNKDKYVNNLCDDAELGFEEVIYDIELKDLCLFIDKDDIWSTEVARYEAKPELSYYKFIRFSDIGDCDEKGYFKANKELVRKFVDENFDMAYFD